MGTVMAIKEPKPATTLDAIGTSGPIGKISRERTETDRSRLVMMEDIKTPRLSAKTGGQIRKNLYDDDVADFFDSRKQMVMRREYTVMGNVDGIATDAGPLRFGKNGPVLAGFNDGTLGFISEWPGLPDELIPTGKLCRHCRAKCDECKGKGKRTCIYPGCGGAGKIFVDQRPCPAKGCCEKTGRFNAECKTCFGSGMIYVPKKCPTCKGSGRATCVLCKGSGSMSTGFHRGARKKPGAAQRLCAHCDGNSIERKPRRQPLAPLITKRIPGTPYVGLGPITKIIFHTVGDGGFRYRVVDVQSDAEGTPMFLLLEATLPGTMMHLMGGVPTLRSRQ